MSIFEGYRMQDTGCRRLDTEEKVQGSEFPVQGCRLQKDILIPFQTLNPEP
jgi:hypothetical protein